MLEIETWFKMQASLSFLQKEVDMRHSDWKDIQLSQKRPFTLRPVPGLKCRLSFLQKGVAYFLMKYISRAYLLSVVKQQCKLMHSLSLKGEQAYAWKEYMQLNNSHTLETSVVLLPLLRELSIEMSLSKSLQYFMSNPDFLRIFELLLSGRRYGHMGWSA